MIKIVLLFLLCAFFFCWSILCAVGLTINSIQSNISDALDCLVLFWPFTALGTAYLMSSINELKKRKKKGIDIDFEWLSAQIKTDKK